MSQVFLQKVLLALQRIIVLVLIRLQVRKAFQVLVHRVTQVKVHQALSQLKALSAPRVSQVHQVLAVQVKVLAFHLSLQNQVLLVLKAIVYQVLAPRVSQVLQASLAPQVALHQKSLVSRL